MRSVAKGLPRRLAATAQGHRVFAGQVKDVPQVIDKLEWAGDKKRAVFTGFDGDFRHGLPHLVRGSVKFKV
jgi:hypothetical protein